MADVKDSLTKVNSQLLNTLRKKLISHNTLNGLFHQDNRAQRKTPDISESRRKKAAPANISLTESRSCRSCSTLPSLRRHEAGLNIIEDDIQKFGAPRKSDIQQEKSILQVESTIPEVYSRDVSYIQDDKYLARKAKKVDEDLKKILGLKISMKESLHLPTDIEEVEKIVFKRAGQEQLDALGQLGCKLVQSENVLFDDPEHMKFVHDIDDIKMNAYHLKREKSLKIKKEHTFLFRTQTNLIQSQIPIIYENNSIKASKSERAISRDADTQRKLLNTDTIMNTKLSTEKLNEAEQFYKNTVDNGIPSGRREAELLNYWFEVMLDKYVHSMTNTPVEKRVKAAQLIYTLCLKEIIRQVSIHCHQRGTLLEKVWNAQIKLYSKHEDSVIRDLENMKMKLKESVAKNAQDYEDKITQLKKKYAELKSKFKQNHKLLSEVVKDKRALESENEKDVDRLKALERTLNDLIVENALLKDQIKFNEFRGAAPEYKPHKTVETKTVSTEIDTDIQYCASLLENTEIISKTWKLKPERYLVMYGYFDLNGYFHRKQVIEQDGRFNTPMVTEFPDDIVMLTQTRTQGSCTTQDAENDLMCVPTSEYIYYKQRAILKDNLDNITVAQDTNRIHRIRKSRDLAIIAIFNRLIDLKILRKTRTLSVEANPEQIDGTYGMSFSKSNLRYSQNETDQGYKNNSKISIHLNSFIDTPIPQSPSNQTEQRSIDFFQKDNSLYKYDRKHTDTEKSEGNWISMTEGEDDSKEDSPTDTTSVRRRTDSKPIPKKSPMKGKNTKAVRRIPKRPNTVKSSSSARSMINPRQMSVKSSLSKTKSSSPPAASNSKIKLRYDIPHLRKHSKSLTKIADQLKLTSGVISQDNYLEQLQNCSSLISKAANTLLKDIKIVSNYQNDLESQYINQLSTEISSNSTSDYKEVSFMDSDPESLLQKRDKLHTIRELSAEGSTRNKLIKDSLPLRLHVRLVKLKKTLSEMLLKDNLSKVQLNDDKLKKRAHKLRVVIDDMYETMGAPNTIKKLFSTGVQTDITGNVFLERLLHNSVFINQGDLLEGSNDTEESRPTSQPTKLINKKESSEEQLKSELKRGRIEQMAKLFLLSSHKHTFLTKGRKLLNSIMRRVCVEQINCSTHIRPLLKIINRCYLEKMIICKEHPRFLQASLADVLYEYLLQFYGLKHVSEEKFLHIIISAIHHSEKSSRIRNFLGFLGIPENLKTEDWNFYLHISGFLNYCTIGKHIINEDTAINHYTSLTRALYAAHMFFGSKLPGDIFEQLNSEIENLKITESVSLIPAYLASRYRPVDKVITDDFLEIMLKYYKLLKNKFHQRACLIFTKTINNSTELIAEELYELLEVLDMKLTQEDKEKIFKVYSYKNKESLAVISWESFLTFTIDNEAVDILELFEKARNGTPVVDE